MDLKSILDLRESFSAEDASPVVLPEPGKALHFAQKEEPVEKSVSQIRENFDRLQALHQRLHAILAELNRLGDKDPKKKN